MTDSFASTAVATLTPSPDVLPAATPSVAATRGPGAPWGRLLVLVPLSFAIGALGTGVRRALGGRFLADAVGG